MMNLKIKICGITRIEDAVLATDLGAALIGFIFTESPRKISVVDAKNISQSLPAHIQKIGVFSNATLTKICQVVRQSALTGVQLHGQETPDFVREVKSALKNYYVIKSLVSSDVENKVASYDASFCDALLLDSPREKNKSRVSLSVTDIEQYRTRGSGPALFLAGGINQQNFSDYLQAAAPDGLDISSGVESAPGKKDPAALKDFFAALKGHQR